MNRSAFLAIALPLALACAAVRAAPSPQEVREVLDYFYHGQAQGPMLVELKLCDDVHTKGELKNECVNVLNEQQLKSGEPVNVWMMFLVPNKLEPQDVMVQLNYDGTTMAVERSRITSAIRYRTWKSIKPDRPGAWVLKVFHDTGEDLQMIKEVALNVVP